MRASATVASLAKMRPEKPLRTSSGTYPAWSRCAWVSTTAATEAGGTGSGAQLRSRHAFSPWNSPQSTSTRACPEASRYFEPVTVPAAPRKVSAIAIACRRAACVGATDATLVQVGSLA